MEYDLEEINGIGALKHCLKCKGHNRLVKKNYIVPLLVKGKTTLARGYVCEKCSTFYYDHSERNLYKNVKPGSIVKRENELFFVVAYYCFPMNVGMHIDRMNSEIVRLKYLRNNTQILVYTFSDEICGQYYSMPTFKDKAEQEYNSHNAFYARNEWTKIENWISYHLPLGNLLSLSLMIFHHFISNVIYPFYILYSKFRRIPDRLYTNKSIYESQDDVYCRS